MPEDKDFKRLVRARMAKTGERYTEARSRLRPEGPTTAPRAQDSEQPRQMPPTVTPVDVETLVDMRSESRRAATEQKHQGSSPLASGRRWELTVAAGGPLDAIGAASLSLRAVAALGTALQGVGYLAMGRDFSVPLPDGAPVGPLVAPPGGMLSQAQAELLTVVRERTGFAVPPEGHAVVLTGHRSRTGIDEEGLGRLEARTETGVMVRPGEEAVVDLAAILAGATALAGRVWASYGVIVIIDHAFPLREFSPGSDAMVSSPFPDVDREFWDQAGEAMTSAATSVQLPPWPLDDAWLRSLSSFVRIGARYRPKWSKL